MIREAQLRIAHNKQRKNLKTILRSTAGGRPVVKVDDLMLACERAKVDVPREKLAQTPFATVRDAHPCSSLRLHLTAQPPTLRQERDLRGSPKSIAWEGFHKSLEYPLLKGHGEFGPLPPTRRQRREEATLAASKNLKAAYEQGLDAANTDGKAPEASDTEVYFHWQTLKRMMETRFSEMRRAFRLIDEDSSGSCSRTELKFMLNAMFNLTIPEHVLDRLIDMADFDGDGEINFAEFARIMTCDNVLNMKKTLRADETNWGQDKPSDTASNEPIDFSALAQINRKMAGHTDGGYHPKLRRPGPGIHALRRAHKKYKAAINLKFNSNKEAFKAIDTDGSGLIRRAEIRRFLNSLSKSIPDRVISGLIDFCDSDGDAKTLNMNEFVKMMDAEFLGADGLDPTNGH